MDANVTLSCLILIYTILLLSRCRSLYNPAASASYATKPVWFLLFCCHSLYLYNAAVLSPMLCVSSPGAVADIFTDCWQASSPVLPSLSPEPEQPLMFPGTFPLLYHLSMEIWGYRDHTMASVRARGFLHGLVGGAAEFFLTVSHFSTTSS